MGRLPRLLAVTALVTATGAFVQAPAHAAACDSADGVTVVVDFNQLGGGVHTACVADQGQADDLFRAAGHTLEDVQQQPGFVCRVDGKPNQEQDACVRTPPSNAYWSLWWSDGTSGGWTYAQQGADSLDVPDGGSVGFSWKRSQPSATPPDHDGSGGGAGGGSGSANGSGGRAGGGDADRSSAPDPSSSPDATVSPEPGSSSPRPDRRGAGRGEKGEDPGREGKRGAEKSSQQKQARADRRAERDEVAGAESASPTADQDVVAGDPPDDPDGGLPVWVAPAAIGALLAGAAVAAYLRRRSAGA